MRSYFIWLVGPITSLKKFPIMNYVFGTKNVVYIVTRAVVLKAENTFYF